MQDACVSCHGAELKAADDKHPLAKFTDPRNAELLERIDATSCVACHTEHRPAMTNATGVTQPDDVCFHCHSGIAEERESHAGMAFDTCASSGCHNFHDNRALYEDFLLRHLDDPAIVARPLVSMRNLIEIAAMLPDYPSDRYPVEALTAERADAPSSAATNLAINADWLASSHARAGVNCSGCHGSVGGSAQASVDWIARPDHQACTTCHAPEADGFLKGKHGMRLAHGFRPMTPAQARLPMRSEAKHTELTCTTCHGAHRFDARTAAVDACLTCHADEHSLAFRASKHFELWRAELEGRAPAGSGVSCATCHMPRTEQRDPDLDLRRVVVQHNQNDTLRPNEKMLRPVCLSCHGLGFAIDALADPRSIRTNFDGPPATHIRSLEMAAERLRKHEAQRRASMSSTVE
jgi:predicted CXXCH cytochrome family protein